MRGSEFCVPCPNLPILWRQLHRRSLAGWTQPEPQPLGNQEIAITGAVLCQGQILVEVEKVLAVRSGSGQRALVQTTAYRYHASIPGIGNILRYENSDHHQFDHVHRYDPLRGDLKGTFHRIEQKNDVPTLGQVLRELREWYEENAEKLTAT